MTAARRLPSGARARPALRAHGVFSTLPYAYLGSADGMAWRPGRMKRARHAAAQPVASGPRE